MEVEYAVPVPIPPPPPPESGYYYGVEEEEVEEPIDVAKVLRARYSRTGTSESLASEDGGVYGREGHRGYGAGWGGGYGRDNGY